jgi:hypothetical protein
MASSVAVELGGGVAAESAEVDELEGAAAGALEEEFDDSVPHPANTRTQPRRRRYRERVCIGLTSDQRSEGAILNPRSIARFRF